MIKYGDLYLRLYRESDYKDPIFDQTAINNTYNNLYGARNVLNEDLKENINLSVRKTHDPYSYYVEMVADPSTMFELTRYGVSSGYVEVPNLQSGLNNSEAYTGTTGLNSLNGYNYKLKSGDINIYQADDFVHAFLQDNVSRFPETVEIFKTEDDLINGVGYSYEVRRGKSMLYDSYKT